MAQLTIQCDKCIAYSVYDPPLEEAIMFAIKSDWSIKSDPDGSKVLCPLCVAKEKSDTNPWGQKKSYDWRKPVGSASQ